MSSSDTPSAVPRPNAATTPSTPMLMPIVVATRNTATRTMIEINSLDMKLLPLSLCGLRRLHQLDRDARPAGPPRGRSAGGTTPRSRRPGSRAPPPAAPGTAVTRRSSSRVRSAPFRSRTNPPFRSSPRRAPSPRRPGCARSSATVAAVPASAFWWQWPWKTIGRLLTSAAGIELQRAVVDRLDEQLLDEARGRRDRLARAGRRPAPGAPRAASAGTTARSRRSGRRARPRAPAARPSPPPCAAPGRAGPWRCSSARSSRRSPAARSSPPPRAARSRRGRSRAR